LCLEITGVWLIIGGVILIVASINLEVDAIRLVVGSPEVVLLTIWRARRVVVIEVAGVGHLLIVGRTAAVGLAVAGSAGHPAVGGLVEEGLVLEEGEKVVVVGVVCHKIKNFIVALKIDHAFLIYPPKLFKA
jgi:hypothetical protein